METSTARLIVVCTGLVLLCLMFSGPAFARISAETCVGMHLPGEGRGGAAGDSSGEGNDGKHVALDGCTKWLEARAGTAPRFGEGVSSMKNHKRNGICLAWLVMIAAAVIMPFIDTRVRAEPTRRSYTLYQPTISHSMVYAAGTGANPLLYNHCPAMEFFNGLFYVVWQGNPENAEGKSGQKLYLSTSSDFVSWSEKVAFTDSPTTSVDPLNAEDNTPQKQPVMLTVNNGAELWCAWVRHPGTYVSKLTDKPGAKWTHHKIFDYATVDGVQCFSYTAQNPVQASSGRVLLPLTLISKARPVKRYAVFLYTDDGQEWLSSNVVTLPFDAAGQWEPHISEQVDGLLRVFYRNMTSKNPKPTERLLTCVGTGVELGTPVIIDPDPEYSRIETANCRHQIIRLSSGRWCMFHHDVYTEFRAYENRTNAAVYFSRTGRDDYVAGPGFSRRDDINAYAQGIEHDGKIYVVYTLGTNTGPRHIESAVLDPAPKANALYVWPRDKDRLELKRGGPVGAFSATWIRTNTDYFYTRPYLESIDGRNAVAFENGGTAGVEVYPVDFVEGQSLELRFAAKVLSVQPVGNLVLCSLGDLAPIRLAMPANRVGRLYAQSADGWQDAGPMPLNKWADIVVTFGVHRFSVQLAGEPAWTYRNPVADPKPRLYLGDGYEVDYYSSNTGDSKFYIDLDSLQTRILKMGSTKEATSPPAGIVFPILSP